MRRLQFHQADLAAVAAPPPPSPSSTSASVPLGPAMPARGCAWRQSHPADPPVCRCGYRRSTGSPAPAGHIPAGKQLDQSLVPFTAAMVLNTNHSRPKGHLSGRGRGIASLTSPLSAVLPELPVGHALMLRPAAIPIQSRPAAAQSTPTAPWRTLGSRHPRHVTSTRWAHSEAERDSIL